MLIQYIINLWYTLFVLQFFLSSLNEKLNSTYMLNLVLQCHDCSQAPEPEVSYTSHPVRDLLLMGRKRNAILPQTRRANLTVLEFFAVGNSLNAFLFWAVKSGVARYRIQSCKTFLLRPICGIHFSIAAFFSPNCRLFCNT